MASHSHHPPIRETGFSDECERCTEMALDPVIHLDSENLSELIFRTRVWMRDEGFPRSTNEHVAMSEMEKLLVRMERVMAL